MLKIFYFFMSHPFVQTRKIRNIGSSSTSGPGWMSVLSA